MHKILARLAVAVLVAGSSGVAAVATAGPALAAGPCGTVSTAPVYKHVIWIWMENHSYGDIIGNKAQAPYLNALASECGLATNYHNISHPSLPNYLALTSGSTWGIADDGWHPLPAGGLGASRADAQRRYPRSPSRKQPGR